MSTARTKRILKTMPMIHRFGCDALLLEDGAEASGACDSAVGTDDRANVTISVRVVAGSVICCVSSRVAAWVVILLSISKFGEL